MPTLRYSLTVDAPLAISDYASVTYTEHTSGVKIVNTVTDEALAFGGVTTADVVYLKPTAAATVKFNAGATATTLDANKPFFQGGTAVTAITITTAADCTMEYMLAGA